MFFVLRTGMFLPRDAVLLRQTIKTLTKQKAKKNDELQNNISNISLSRSLHIKSFIIIGKEERVYKKGKILHNQQKPVLYS